jgi:hypothetical protein
MSKQTFVITPKNYPRALEVVGEHAAVLASGEVGSELFLKEGSRGSTSPRHRRPSERAATKTFSKAIHRLKEDVRSWYELHRRNDEAAAALGQLKTEWAQSGGVEKRSCMVTTQIGGFASYVELLTCSEMTGGVTGASGPSR